MLKLVYGCLAFSLVACIFLFVAAARSGDGFHGMTKSMGDALNSGATVLDADRDGAITQTGNGKVAGYRRSGDETWSTKFDRFKETPSNPYGAGANDATAWCMTACPTALVGFESGYSAFGGVSERFVDELNKLSPKSEDVMALTGRDTAFLRVSPPTNATPQLYVLESSGRFTLLGVLNPSEVQPVQPRDRAVVGSARGKVGVLGQVALRAGRWQATDRSITEVGLKNVCVSDDERWIGAVGTRISRTAFGSASGAAFGPPVTSGTCTVDENGTTAIFTPRSAPETVVAARYSAGGRTIWRHDFGAQRLLSPAGSPIVVTQAADGNVTAIDALTGRNTYSGKLVGVPFVCEDGSIVTADRQGHPHWVLSGKAAKPQ
ncbi:MAG: hypothetical protein JHC98_09920 [Thermoleophilaceae bacterium]|nr:hypothetical protein [Thermoleophilaceae bacterium]